MTAPATDCLACGHPQDRHYDNTLGGVGPHATGDDARGCVAIGSTSQGGCDCDGYEAPAFDEPAGEGPEDGHTWRIAVESRGSYAVVGEPHTDADYWTPSGEIEVREWSLPAALRKAAGLPLSAWPGHRDERWPASEPPAEPAVDAVVDALTVWLALPYADAARVAGRIVTDLRRRGVIPEPAPAEPASPYPNGTRVVHPEHGPGKVGSQAPSPAVLWVEFDRDQGHGPLDIPVMRCVDVADLTPEGRPAVVRVADLADLGDVWIGPATEPTLGIHVGQTVLANVHPVEVCQAEGHPCVIHSPSDHHMRDWPTLWRGDRRLMERTCPHGVGHPDPDDLAFHERQGRTSMGVHGCDGCCVAPGA